MTKIRVKQQIDKLMDPNDGTATVRTFITPHPLKKDEEPRYYKSCRSPYFGDGLEIHCASEGCADLWLNLPGNRIFVEEGDIKPEE